ncbi:MAG: hypothetical protein ACRCZB_09850 [Bacteroidales bacterium]
MEEKKGTAQSAVGAKTAQTQGQAQNTKVSSRQPQNKQQPTPAELLKERTKLIQEQFELSKKRETLISTGSDIATLLTAIEQEFKNGNYNATDVSLTINTGYTDIKRIEISNPTIVSNFLVRIKADIEVKVSQIEKALIA